MFWWFGKGPSFDDAVYNGLDYAWVLRWELLAVLGFLLGGPGDGPLHHLSSAYPIGAFSPEPVYEVVEGADPWEVVLVIENTDGSKEWVGSQAVYQGRYAVELEVSDKDECSEDLGLVYGRPAPGRVEGFEEFQGIVEVEGV